jgi:membrane protein YdbS with pleckstrin-like domain
VVLAAVTGPAEAAAGLAAGLVLLGLVLQAVERRWRAWGYLEREDDLVVQRGVLVNRTSVVPYGRMQYVDVTAGPLDRRLG